MGGCSRDAAPGLGLGEQEGTGSPSLGRGPQGSAEGTEWRTGSPSVAVGVEEEEACAWRLGVCPGVAAGRILCGSEGPGRLEDRALFLCVRLYC